jgi:hypothetical protein
MVITSIAPARRGRPVVQQWPTYFEGRSADAVKFFGVKRISAFMRAGAIPVA